MAPIRRRFRLLADVTTVVFSKTCLGAKCAQQGGEGWGIGQVRRMEEDVLMRTAVRRAPEGTWRRGRPKTIWRRTAEAEMRDLVHRRGTIELVSWFFKPSQPERIISRLGETFIKRCIVERTSTAELRPEKKKTD